jgi:predicted amidohydrolase YtcJ
VRKLRQTSILALAFCAVACGQDGLQAADSPAADLVLTNAKLYTVDDAKPTGSSLAVRGGRIVALGSQDETAPFIGPQTRVFDLGGRLVLPAFHDAHTHPVWGGLSHARCPLYEGNSPADYQRIIAQCARDEPGTGWLYGVGWRDGLFAPEGVPHKKLLDEIVPDRPAAFANVGGHGLWVNSKGLEVAGITRDTPDPPNGRIDRDANGEPIGGLQEAAVELVVSKLPPPSAQARVKALTYARDHFNSIGIVGWHDALVPISGEQPGQAIPPGVPETYATLAASKGGLEGYATLALGWDRARGLEQIPELVAASERLAQAGVDARTVKFLLDGVPVQRTAALLEPYADKPGYHGELQVDQDVLEQAAVELDAKGFQLHMHTIGDGAVRAAMQAFAKARERNGARERRSLISHDNLISEHDLKRAAELGVVAVFQPLWATLDEYMQLVAVRVGPQRMTHMYPVASLMRAGGRVAYGSDWPVGPAEPFQGIEVALTRRAPGTTTGERLSPLERITLPEAIRNYTLHSAYALRVDDRSGSLTVGKNADLVVVDRDVFKSAETDIAKTKVLLTMHAGEVVHGKLADVATPVRP